MPLDIFKKQGLCKIPQRYEAAGYLEVPKASDVKAGKENHCKICGKENDDYGFAKVCPDCSWEYSKARKANKKIAEISVREMELVDFLVFQSIATQMINHETPYATIEEYATELKIRRRAEEEFYHTKTPEERQREAILYS